MKKIALIIIFISALRVGAVCQAMKRPDEGALAKKILFVLYPKLDLTKMRMEVNRGNAPDDFSDYSFSVLVDDATSPERKNHSEDDELLHVVVHLRSGMISSIQSEGRYVSSVRLAKMRDTIAAQKITKHSEMSAWLRKEGAKFPPSKPPAATHLRANLRQIIGSVALATPQFKYSFSDNSPALFWDITGRAMQNGQPNSLRIEFEPFDGRVSAVRLDSVGK